MINLGEMEVSPKMAEETITTILGATPAQKKDLLLRWQAGDPEARAEVIHQRLIRWHVGQQYNAGLR